MIASILRLFALRPLFSLALFGFPILLLVVVGLFAMVALKFLVFVVAPALLVLWLVRRIVRAGRGTAG